MPTDPEWQALVRSAQTLSVLAFSLKLLLFPAAHSTDLEVHRHWKALTHNLPLALWYTDTSSQWMLDYPPLFAYFEYALSHAAAVCHPAMLDLSAHDYTHPHALAFLRTTVLATDPLFSLAAFRYASALVPAHKPQRARRVLSAFALIVLLPGLYLVDNVHFQYNTLPLSLLLLTLSSLLRTRPVSAAIFFSATLNLKHTFLPAAPAVAATLLRQSRSPRTFLLVAGATAGVFALLWAPLLIAGGAPLLAQTLRRLFPLSRGLLHAYWAPNAWAVYAGLDKVAAALGYAVRATDVDAASGRIGGRRPFACLPNPTAGLCAGAVGVVACAAALRVRRAGDAPRAAAAAGLAAFALGWHVHEKAVLVPLVPLAGLAGAGGREADAFLWLAVGGQFGLFPLAGGGAESMYKIAHFAGYVAAALGVVIGERFAWRTHGALVAYAGGAALVEMYAGVGGGHARMFGERLPFMPLALVSVYGAVGVAVSFWKLVGVAVFSAGEVASVGEWKEAGCVSADGQAAAARSRTERWSGVERPAGRASL